MSMKLMMTDVMKVTDRIVTDIDAKFELARNEHFGFIVDLEMYQDGKFTFEKHNYVIHGRYDENSDKYIFELRVDCDLVLAYREDTLMTWYCDVDFTGFVMAVLTYVCMKENF